MVIILSLLAGTFLAALTAYIGRCFELKGVSKQESYPTRHQLFYVTVIALLFVQGMASMFLSVKLFAISDMSLTFFGTVLVLILLKGPAESIMRWLMPFKKKVD